MTFRISYFNYSNHAVKRVIAICFIAILFPFFAIAQKKIELRFASKVGKESLQLGNSYTNAAGEPFMVYKFKYYIHNIQVSDSSMQFVILDKAHYLIDAADTASSIIRLNKPVKKKIAYIRFAVGVDSILNTSGVQTGVLDPLKGMFWTWNTGYIYAKLEGKSSASKARGNIFSYDVGGYKGGENAVCIVTLPVTQMNSILVIADVLKWFEGNSPISIATQAICHEPGKFAMQLAANYMNMFSIANTNN